MRWLIISALATVAYGADIVVFGTSLSDDGHGITPLIRDRFNNPVLVYPEPEYYNGRWTNGWVWSDFLQDYYNYTVHNEAIGGSALGAYPTSVLNDSYITIPKHFGKVPGRENYLLPLPTLMDQVMDYIKQHKNAVNKSDIFILEFGASDTVKFLQRGQALLAKTKFDLPDLINAVDRGELKDFSQTLMETLTQSMSNLYYAGGRKFLVFGLVPLHLTPRMELVATDYRSLLSRIIDIVVTRLNTALVSLRFNFMRDHPGAIVDVFDIASAYRSMTGSADDFGFSNVRGPCYSQTPAGYDSGAAGKVCDSPDAHMFWDEVHLTRRGHGVLAERMLPQIRGLANA